MPPSFSPFLTQSVERPCLSRDNCRHSNLRRVAGRVVEVQAVDERIFVPDVVHL